MSSVSLNSSSGWLKEPEGPAFGVSQVPILAGGSNPRDGETVELMCNEGTVIKVLAAMNKCRKPSIIKALNDYGTE